VAPTTTAGQRQGNLAAWLRENRQCTNGSWHLDGIHLTTALQFAESLVFLSLMLLVSVPIRKCIHRSANRFYCLLSASIFNATQLLRVYCFLGPRATKGRTG